MVILINVFSYITTVYQFSICFAKEFSVLTPYTHQHGSRLNYRAIQDCHQHGNEPYEIYDSHVSNDKISNFVEVKYFLKKLQRGLSETIIHGHYAIISDPIRTLSVLEPLKKHGCSLNLRQTVVETAKQRNCEVAINAGYFDTKSGHCLGNVISDGYLAHNSDGIQNAHFGLTKDNKIFIGYVPESDVKQNSNFLQLIGGVVWVIRNGSSYVNMSKYFECEKTEETGSMEQFVNVLSSRTVIGHDNNGKVVILQVDGKTNYYGLSLWEMENLAKEMGLFNAINLDGGGSSTFVVNGSVVNYPSDECSPNTLFACERKVSTIICIHPPSCEPHDCNNHGQCNNGICICEKYWLPPYCDKLSCPNNCMSQGNCTVNGCQCYPGYCGENCVYDKNCTMDKIAETDFHIVYSNIKSLIPYIIAFSAIISGVILAGLLLVFYSCSCSCRSQQRFCKRQKRHRYMDLQTLTGFSDSSDDEHSPADATK